MMAIVIDNQENKFEVKGEIDQESSLVLKEYIETQFNRFSKVIMNIDFVSKIDKSGIAVLASIYQDSVETGKVFTITGEGCKEIYDDFLMSA